MTDRDTSGPVGRRNVLQVLGAGATVGLAGCAGQTGDQGGGDTPTEGGGGDTATDTPADDQTSTPTATAGGEASYTIGFAAESLRDAFKTTLKRVTELYIRQNGHEVMSANAGGDAAKQSQQIKNMLNSGIDALLLDPTSQSIASVVEQATSQDVPVFTINGTVNDPGVSMYVALGNRLAGYKAGQALAERVTSSDLPGRLFEVQGSLGTPVGVQRSEGFNRAIDETDGVEVVGQVTSENWSQTEVITKTSSFLRTNPNIGGAYTAWGLAAMGVLQAFDREDMKMERGNEGHVPVATIDGIPTVLENIRSGFLDVGIMQPVPFYPAIALEFLWDFLDAGKDAAALPETGTELAASQVDAGTEESVSPDPWQEPYWAPADVLEYTADDETLYPFVRTQALTVTPENVDAPYLWGNLGLAE